MATNELATAIREAVTAGLVFAPPYEHDGVGVVPGARVSGAVAGGHGSQEGQEGEGRVFRVGARPVGAFVVSDGRVRWKPAIDVNRLVAILSAVVIALLVARTAVARARLKCSVDRADDTDVEAREPADELTQAPAS